MARQALAAELRSSARGDGDLLVALIQVGLGVDTRHQVVGREVELRQVDLDSRNMRTAWRLHPPIDNHPSRRFPDTASAASVRLAQRAAYRDLLAGGDARTRNDGVDRVADHAVQRRLGCRCAYASRPAADVEVLLRHLRRHSVCLVVGGFWIASSVLELVQPKCVCDAHIPGISVAPAPSITVMPATGRLRAAAANARNAVALHEHFTGYGCAPVASMMPKRSVNRTSASEPALIGSRARNPKRISGSDPELGSRPDRSDSTRSCTPPALARVRCPQRADLLPGCRKSCCALSRHRLRPGRPRPHRR